MSAHGEVPLELVVTSGTDAGRRLRPSAKASLIGRAREADLALVDLTVSRRHLEVVLRGNVLVARVCERASSARVHGRELLAAELRLGDEITIGETTLQVVEAEAPLSKLSVTQVSEVATILGGRAEDARGFAAVFGLIEDLDRARDRGAVEEVLSNWGARHLETTAVQLVARDDVRVVTTHDGDKTQLSVPVPAHGALVFELRREADGPSEHRQRLALVAARVCASALTRLQHLQRVEEENASLRSLALGNAHSFLGESAKAREITRLIPRLAASDSSVLLLGETGCGKSFVARLIHEASARASAPFRALNCAAIPESLIEAELFGHERGAFTGAASARVGAFESAGEGTLFLDEIGELSLASQSKLLRALEERRFERLGSNRSLPLKARVLAATNRDLHEMMTAGRFRADLFYRVSVVSLAVPPLRERRDDLQAIATQLLSDLAPSAPRRVEGFTKEALEVITRYDWPGNVRELRNAIERALVLGDGPRIEPADLPDMVRGARPPQDEGPDTVRLPARLDELEARAIEAAMRTASGNRTRAAALLGINRVTLYKKLRDEKTD